MQSSAIMGSDGSKMIVLKLRRPTLLEFKPGQYAFLKCHGWGDSTWHPFSFASSPDSSELEFNIQVYEGNEWTNRLWDLLDEHCADLFRYGISVLILILGVTSYFRHQIPYEIFYGIHHLAFIIYILTIAHTIDNEQRAGAKARSQAFRWCSSTFLYFIFDRLLMRLNHKYNAKLMQTPAARTLWEQKM